MQTSSRIKNNIDKKIPASPTHQSDDNTPTRGVHTDTPCQGLITLIQCDSGYNQLDSFEFTGLQFCCLYQYD